ncbi:MAG: AI-2E family transporter [Actinobacteria bacterium]|nr:AI-2E family transporter [Actinomycetota bacterium]MBU1943272.1 AI-2E family transporter [Actinomycetota bacterium]MBU2688979.1 AI-2E family transporter [Actinomycetota bacterium]
MTDTEEQARAAARSNWLARWGRDAWYLIGLIGVLIFFVYLLNRAYQIVWPLAIAVMLGIVLWPIPDFLHRKLRFPRWLGAAITMILVLCVIVLITGVVTYGIVSESDEISAEVQSGVDQVKDWLGDLDLSDSTVDWIQQSVSKLWPSLISGVTSALTGSLSGIASFLVGLILGLFILFFLLNDDGTISRWVMRKMPVSEGKARMVFEDVATSIRGYWSGTTIIAAANALMVLPVLLIFRMPLVVAVTFIIFVTAYIPSIGGYIGGAFAVFIALASNGLTVALVMLVVLILINSVFQQPIQAYAYHHTLELHPLVALIMTVLGAIFAGLVGAILAVPITAVILKVKTDLQAVQEGKEVGAGPPGPAEDGAVTS